MLFELRCVFPRLRIVGHHGQISNIVHLVGAVGNNLDQFVVPVCERLAVLNNDAAVLAISKVVLAQVSPSDHD